MCVSGRPGAQCLSLSLDGQEVAASGLHQGHGGGGGGLAEGEPPHGGGPGAVQGGGVAPEGGHRRLLGRE